MGVIDIVLILVFLYGIYSGFQSGFLKMFSNFIVLLITTLVAGKLSDIMFGLLYNFFPFFNFSGKTEGLKAVNIIVWKLILYILIFAVVLTLIESLLSKFKIKEKIANSMINVNVIGKIFGSVLSIPLVFTLVFNTILILLVPFLNFKLLTDSKVANMIMTKTPILANANRNLYNNQTFIINRINKKDNTIKGYKRLNKDIVENMLDTNLVSKEIIETLEDGNKLLGTRNRK